MTDMNMAKAARAVGIEITGVNLSYGATHVLKDIALSIRPGEFVAQKYRVVRMIGQGAMGSVFEAVHALTERSVALKVLAEDLKTRGVANPRIWCNAASTGEEPYSLAMTVVETLGVSAQAKLVCSDIDTKVLATAQRGVYDADARGLSPERMHRHFLRGKGSNAGFMRVKPDLAKLASPVAHLDKSDPPLLLIHGTADSMIPPAQSERMHAALKAAGADSSLLLIKASVSPLLTT